MRGKTKATKIETTDLCSYGCGYKANFKFDNGNLCCSEQYTKCPALKKRNSEGVKKAYSEGRGYTNYTPEIREKMSDGIKKTLRKRFDRLLKETPFHKLSKRTHIKIISEKQKGKCAVCGLDEWNGKKLTLELHHKKDNIENENDLCLLCPNCHSQTSSWRKKKII